MAAQIHSKEFFDLIKHIGEAKSKQVYMQYSYFTFFIFIREVTHSMFLCCSTFITHILTHTGACVIVVIVHCYYIGRGQDHFERTWPLKYSLEQSKDYIETDEGIYCSSIVL